MKEYVENIIITVIVTLNAAYLMTVVMIMKVYVCNLQHNLVSTCKLCFSMPNQVFP